MASSASGQDDPNCALWLATRAGKMEPLCPFRTTSCIPQEKFPQKPYNKSFIDQVLAVKMAEHWPRSFFASLWASSPSRSISTQKKNLANIQASWPHTWSITHIEWYVGRVQFDQNLPKKFPYITISSETETLGKSVSDVFRVEQKCCLDWLCPPQLWLGHYLEMLVNTWRIVVCPVT